MSFLLYFTADMDTLVRSGALYRYKMSCIHNFLLAPSSFGLLSQRCIVARTFASFAKGAAVSRASGLRVTYGDWAARKRWLRSYRREQGRTGICSSVASHHDQPGDVAPPSIQEQDISVGSCRSNSSSSTYLPKETVIMLPSKEE